MILDSLGRLDLYRGLPPRVVAALEFLGTRDPAILPLGRIEIDGDRLYALVQEYETKPPAPAAWEAHRRYIDVQFLAAGEERIGAADIGAMRLAQPYDETRDVAFFTGEGDFFTLTPGRFAVFVPHDVHLPGLAVVSPGRVRKIVVKAAVKP